MRVPTTRHIIATVVLGLLAGRLAAAEPAAAPADDPKELLRAAYAKSQNAKTSDDYTTIIALCEQAQRSELTPDLSAYAKQLMSWSHNRRGEAHSERASSLAESGKKEEATKADAEALAEFDRAVELNPKHWKALHNRGVSYALERKLEEAVKDFTAVIVQKADYANTWFNRGEIYFEQGQLDKALADYREAFRLKPTDHEACIRCGHANFQLKRYREALSDYSRAIELAPKNAELLSNRGEAYACLGMWSEAAADFRSAIAMGANSARAYQSAAWMMATCPDPQFRDNERATLAAEKAVQLAGRQEFQYPDTLAAAYANAGQFDKALEAIGEALKVAPPAQQAALEARRALYQRRQPYRQTRPTAAPSAAERES